MDIKSVAGKLQGILKKNIFPILMLLIGILLMLIPGKDRTQIKNTETQPPVTEQKEDVGKQLEAILSQIKGVGKVQVMLTEAEGEQYRYQFDESIHISEGNSSSEKDTVIITDGDRNQSPILWQVIPAKYKGAIIVCQGAQDPAVKLAVVEAVSCITGLGADAISVLKMK